MLTENMRANLASRQKLLLLLRVKAARHRGLRTFLQKRLGVEARTYIPETLGGRNGGLTACLGLFYAYQDKLPITGNMDDSLDMDAFIKAVSYREKKNDTYREDTLTNKLKGLFLEGKKN